MQANDTPPNVVLVSIDSLRADHCGFLGDDRGLTPTLDGLAEEGLSFQNAIATGPQTFSSMPAVFTGYHRPWTTLQSNTELDHWERRLVSIQDHLERHATLPEQLQTLGYTTAGISPNPWTSSNSGWDRGFDHFQDLSDTGKKSRLERVIDRVPGIDSDSKSVELATMFLSGRSFFTQWEEFYEQITETVRDLPEPYFLWVFVQDAHFPFITRRSHREEQSVLEMYRSVYRAEAAMRGDVDSLPGDALEAVKRSYRDSVRAVDAFLAELTSDLASDDPVTFVHSDHGESFGDHGCYGHHHRRVYEENVHVPFVVHNAGTSGTVTSPTSLATIYDAVVATGRQEPLDPTTLTDTAVVTSSECGRNRAVRSSQFKYIDGDSGQNLYDLESDPDETRDLTSVRPDLKREYERSLRSFANRQEDVEQLSLAASQVAATGKF